MFLVAIQCFWVMGHESSDSRDGGATLCSQLLPSPPHSHKSHHTSPDGFPRQSSSSHPCLGLFLSNFCAFCMNWTSAKSEFVSALFDFLFLLNHLLRLTIIMSVPESRKSTITCGCGCNRMVSRSTKWCHKKEHPPTFIVQLESPPSPKRRCIAHFQLGQESSIIRPNEQKQSRTDCNFSTSHSHINVSSASDHSALQLHVSSFNSNTSLPSLNSPLASNLLQSPGDALTEASGPCLDNILLNLHARTH